MNRKMRKKRLRELADLEEAILAVRRRTETAVSLGVGRTETWEYQQVMGWLDDELHALSEARDVLRATLARPGGRPSSAARVAAVPLSLVKAGT